MNDDTSSRGVKWMRRLWRPAAGLGGLVVLVIWSGGACESKVAPGKAEYQPGVAIPPGARTYTVQVERVAARVDVIGAAAAEQRVDLSARISASVRELHVLAGDHVTNGQVLAVLDDRDILQQVAAAEAQYKQAQQECRRVQQLFEKAATTAQAREGAEAACQSAAARLQEAQVMLSYTRLASPIDGVVADRRIEAGDLAAPGQVLLSVYDPRNMRFEAPVPMRLIPRFSLGQSLDVALDGFDNPVKGVVREVVSEVDPRSRTQMVKVHLEALPKAVLPGTYGWIWVDGAVRDVRSAPAAAIYRVGQQELVQVVADGRALRRVVTTGEKQGDRVEVLSGLEAGEVVLLDPVKED